MSLDKWLFVELESASDMSKALKWHDLYYKANRRVTVEVADFNDFQNCIKFNQEHEREIMQIQQEFIAQKQQQRQPRHMALLDEFERNQRGPGSPLHQNHDHHNPHPQQQQHHHFNPNLNRPSGRSSLPIDETSHSRRLSLKLNYILINRPMDSVLDNHLLTMHSQTLLIHHLAVVVVCVNKSILQTNQQFQVVLLR